MGVSAVFRHFFKPLGLVVVCAFALSACGGGSADSADAEIGPGVSASGPAPDGISSSPKAALDRWATHTLSGAADAEPTAPDPVAVVLGQGARLNQEALKQALEQQAAALAKSGLGSDAVTKAAAVNLVPVYRFFNTRTGAHFYTINASERDQVVATAPWYTYEGVAFQVSSQPQSGLAPVYRFFNTQSGVHFYTISESEKALIVANLPTFKLEGIAYYASLLPGSGLTPLYRFFRSDRGLHFYTARYTERDATINTNCAYRYEGVAYYVFDANVVANPPAAPSNATVLIVGDSLAQGYGYDIGGDYYSFVSPGQVWTERLASEIKTRTGRSCNQVVNVSVGGMRTEHGLANLQGWLDQYAPTHVILAQGTNDAWQGSPFATIQANLSAMAQTSRVNNRHVYVMDYAFLRNGEAYRQGLTATYQASAVAAQAAYFLGTAAVPADFSYYQPDSVHLRDSAEPLVLETVWQALLPSL
jgi:lysophospholipase L1-like esterase